MILYLLYLLTLGSNINNDIYIIIPARREYIIPSVKWFGIKNKYAKNAPSGSNIEQIKV